MIELGYKNRSYTVFQQNSILHMYLYRSTPIRRALIAHGASAACIGIAIFLRGGRGHSLRESITRMLGYEWRAAVEHLLSAIGVPLFVGVLGLGFLFFGCWLPYALCNFLGWNWKPLARHPREVANLEDLGWMVGIWSTVYLLAAVAWEWDQAHLGVYGAAPRTYLQWEQLGCDFIGVVIALGVARWVSRPRRKHLRRFPSLIKRSMSQSSRAQKNAIQNSSLK